MTPVAPDMITLTFAGVPSACANWMDSLDQLTGWQLVTTVHVELVPLGDGCQVCTVVLQKT